MTEQLEGQVDMFDLGIWSGRTYPELSAVTEGKTSKPSLKKSSKSSKQKSPICLVLSRGGGQRADVCTPTWDIGALLGEYTMLSTGESPREENVSRLSQILEDSAPQKYCLSARACQGILNRAERRGKELPPELKAALIEQSQSTTKPQDTGAVEQDGMMTEEATALASESDSHLPRSPRANGMEFSVSKNEPGDQGGQRNPHSA